MVDIQGYKFENTAQFLSLCSAEGCRVVSFGNTPDQTFSLPFWVHVSITWRVVRRFTFFRTLPPWFHVINQVMGRSESPLLLFSCTKETKITEGFFFLFFQHDVDDSDYYTNGAGYHHSHKYGFGLLDSWRLVNTAKVNVGCFWKVVLIAASTL